MGIFGLAGSSGKGAVYAGGESPLKSFPITTLAFACHTVIFPIYADFKGPDATPAVFRSAVRRALLLCATLYLGVGLCGAFTFRDTTYGDILQNYSAEGSDTVRDGGVEAPKVWRYSTQRIRIPRPPYAGSLP